ncbi:MAG: hypothetical protein IPO85_08680 [Saprospiraceae bacterium]|uniref:WD40 repeat domain-containing protein n=1 Tax=Candidatus Defluviibacterium haderslevense TaxID=2981993 RepID=A0A9D7S8X6_9BACT|nr:hypothetical protein [Candidatus Defluviibacterium haderslevense]
MWTFKTYTFANFINDFSKDILTMSIDATASIWNNSDYAYHSFKIQNSINPPLVTIPLNGKEFLAGGDNGKFRYFRSNDNQLKIESKPDSNSILSSIKFSKQVTSIEISQDGSSILTGHLNNGGAQLSNRRGALLKIFKQPEAIGPAVFSTSGKYIATAGFTENIISLFDTSISDKPINKFVVPS